MQALIIIDLQKALCNQEPLPFNIQQIISNINELLCHAIERNYPVIFVQHEASFIPVGEEGWKILDELSVPDKAIFISKTTANAFLQTKLNASLNDLKVNHLLVCGYASEFCIDTTIRAAAALGYDVTLISDAHTTHSKPHASAEAIILHENATLPELTSFNVKIDVAASREILTLK
ncbi:cysteine hydrolase family protein [Tatumella sp. JGM118]|uniref:Cysteine hydrolase family protein n=1 Tax=Tatumella terrea TaxID=419007 RepID=A0ABW1VYV2_9GAMM|nr:cysteine hydrolase family protein [Tatumella sp. JGM118]MBS0909054.1 cysteine hydrolase [Tatumella sp. JGM118]